MEQCEDRDDTVERMDPYASMMQRVEVVISAVFLMMNKILF
jgi:hypothetical protein